MPRVKRTIERFFESAKRSRILDKNQYVRSQKIELRLNMSVLTYLATMEAHVAADDMDRIRHMRIRVM
ncbi:MAG: hypothetical protein OXC95_09530 [Dehalococcoidia bacterium]|nr:hypothetical protein [Dehalococcoidia bacterium]